MSSTSTWDNSQPHPMTSMQDMGAYSQGPDLNSRAMGCCITMGSGKHRHHLGTSVLFCILPMRVWNLLGLIKLKGEFATLVMAKCNDLTYWRPKIKWVIQYTTHKRIIIRNPTPFMCISVTKLTSVARPLGRSNSNNLHLSLSLKIWISQARSHITHDAGFLIQAQLAALE